MNAAIKPGQHGSLWWKPVAAAVAIAALEVVTKSSVNVQEILRDGLNEIAAKNSTQISKRKRLLMQL
jgi:acetylornithine/succinyldiaminopimelate/putrescine aminotransferase